MRKKKISPQDGLSKMKDKTHDEAPGGSKITGQKKPRGRNKPCPRMIGSMRNRGNRPLHDPAQRAYG